MRPAQVMDRGLERGSGLEIESRYLYLEQAMSAESTWCDYVSYLRF
jgi:hypothetical protein